MGYRHSSAQLSGHGGFPAADRRAAQSAPALSFSPQPTAEAQPVKAPVKSVYAWTLLFLLRCYMIFFSPFFGGACKFQPSCSNYAYEAILLHGARSGTVLAIKRLLRCRPFTVGGLDPVPEPTRLRAQQSNTQPTTREPVL